MVAPIRDAPGAVPLPTSPSAPARSAAPEKRHRWRFFRAGGVEQVQLRDGQDVIHLDQLDQKLWVALAMPTRGIELDERTLELIDTDGDGRIRVPEVLAAVKWVGETWVDPDDLLEGGDRVALAWLREGPVLEAARRTLATLSRDDARELTLADVADAKKRFATLAQNGDGIVPADTTDDFEARRAIDDVLATLGGLTDRSGKPGVDRARVDAFFTAARSVVAWQERAGDDATLLPLGEATAAAAEAVAAVRGKIDDWFVRARLVAFDARAATSIGGTEADLAALGSIELDSRSPGIARLPLAHVEPGQALPLRIGLNPAWVERMDQFVELAVVPLLGARRTKLSEEDWSALLGKLAPHVGWMAEKPATPVAKLGLGRLRELLAGDAEPKLLALVAADQARSEDHERLVTCEKLVRFQRDLFRLLNNFVNFSDFYGKRRGVFQAGTMFIDGRSCELCFVVADAGRHVAMASLSATYLAYCDCTRPDGAKLTIAAAFTGGDSDNVMVGRNGVFYDRKGRDWDATITRIVSHPIGLREAFFAPYKKFARMVDEQLAKRAASADADAHAKLAAAAEKTAYADKVVTTPPPPEPAKKIDIGTVAAIGVAIGGIGAMVAGILSAFFGLGPWMPIGLVALLLMISGPSVALSYLKLRQRNLGPILDANGWAINGRAKVNVPFGAALTSLAKLPAGAERSLVDPYAEKRRPWKLWIAIVVLAVIALAWYLGKMDGFLPEPMRRVHVPHAPAALEPPAAAPGK